MILTMTCFYINVKASSFTFTSKAQKEIVNPGDEVIIDLQISNINAGNEGINVVETSLEYDYNVFDSIEFERQNNWNIEYNNIQNHNKYGKLLFVKISSGVNNDEQIGKLKLKLKQDLEEMETEIKLKQVTSNDGKELILEGDRIIKIRIVKNENSNKPNNSVNENTNKEDEKTNMPKTGQQRIFYIILGIVIIVCIIILIYLKVRNEEKDKS